MLSNTLTAAPTSSGSACFACGLAAGFSHISRVRDAHLAGGREFDHIQCDTCGSIRLNSAVEASELDADYTKYFDRSGESRALTLLRYLSGFLHNRSRFKPRFTSLLEIGCNTGDFLWKLRERGKVVGLERSDAARRAGIRKGITIVNGNVDDPQTFPPSSFDYIYLNHAFEHLPDPNNALDSIYGWLTPGGRLFIGIPNPAGLVARVFGRNWYHFAPPLHITLSTPQGITRMLERHGFEIDRIVYNSDPLSVPMSLYVACGGTIPTMPTPVRILLAMIDVAVKPAVWILDALRCGDCIEVHARKPLAAPRLLESTSAQAAQRESTYA